MIVLADLQAHVEKFRADKVRTLSRAALRQAMIEYRDSKKFPGAAFRFGPHAYRMMGFSRRLRRKSKLLQQDGKLQNPYVRSGSMRSEVLNRKPKISNGTAEVRGKISINARALNLLSQVHPTASTTIKNESYTAVRAAHTRTRNGKTENVAASRPMTFHRRVITAVKKSTNYRDEWAMQQRERNWIQKRADAILQESLNAKAFLKGGGIKKSFLRGDA